MFGCDWQLVLSTWGLTRLGNESNCRSPKHKVSRLIMSLQRPDSLPALTRINESKAPWEGRRWGETILSIVIQLEECQYYAGPVEDITAHQNTTRCNITARVHLTRCSTANHVILPGQKSHWLPFENTLSRLFCCQQWRQTERTDTTTATYLLWEGLDSCVNLILPLPKAEPHRLEGLWVTLR